MTARFGKFTLLQQIGGGRLSQVFHVGPGWTLERSVETTPKVALKRVHPKLIGEPAYVHLVVREAGLLSRLSHPNLCCCLEMGVVDGCAFLTLDLVEGCTLRALMRRLSEHQVRLPTSAILALGCQLADVLDYLHRSCETPLVHLDLSPQNVMLSRQGELKLIDFGIARFLDGMYPPPLGGKIAGTVGYMSPEQARGKQASSLADQYALGILLWELLTGQRLFRGNTVQTWKRMRKGDVPSPKKALKKVSDPLTKALTRLLQVKPVDRFDCMYDALQALRTVSSDPLSGTRPLAALVNRLMDDPSFDPFDTVNQTDPTTDVKDVPRGGPKDSGMEYAEISIEMDQGEGTPVSQVRSMVPSENGQGLPVSPFLETIPEAQPTAEIGS